jgi:hypothetical protein
VDRAWGLGTRPLPPRTETQGAEMMKHAFPDINAHIQDIFAAEDRVAPRLTFRSTHSGEFQGLPGTGRSVEYVSHGFYRVPDGSPGMDLLRHSHPDLPHQLIGTPKPDHRTRSDPASCTS